MLALQKPTNKNLYKIYNVHYGPVHTMLNKFENPTVRHSVQTNTIENKKQHSYENGGLEWWFLKTEAS